MYKLFSWIAGLFSHEASSDDLKEMVGNIPTYTPGSAITAVVIVESRHLASLPASVVCVYSTHRRDIKLVEVDVAIVDD